MKVYQRLKLRDEDREDKFNRHIVHVRRMEDPRYEQSFQRMKRAEIAQAQESCFYTSQSEEKPNDRAEPRGKILLIEDSEIVLKANERFLISLGYQVDTARDGKTAIGLFDDSYDGVILDLGLPDVDGLALCRYMRSRERDHRVPILILTVGGEEKEGECRRAGADLFVQKPLPVTELARMLKRLGLR